MKKVFAVLAMVFAFTLIGAPAMASGSDGPTPYTVSVDGITLPAGAVFQDNGHINVTSKGVTYNVHFEGKCKDRDTYECAGARHAWAQYIGESFIPWTVIFDTKKPYCVEWVQLSQYNEHFGEGGQESVGTGCKGTPPEPEKQTKSEVLPVDCENRIVTTQHYERERPFVWDDKHSVWKVGQWSEWTATNTEQRDATPEECPTEPPVDLPETGGNTDMVLVTSVIAGSLLITGALLFRRRPVQ